MYESINQIDVLLWVYVRNLYMVKFNHFYGLKSSLERFGFRGCVKMAEWGSAGRLALRVG